MMKDRTGLLSAMVLLLVAALVYLPLIYRIGYTHDDWYLMASAQAEGAGVFRAIFSVDRPLRAYVMGPAYSLFGQNVLSFNLSAWMFRFLSALAFLWWLRMLWSQCSRWTLLMALLYLIYPGFLSQFNCIDYQSQILSLALAMLSLALTVYVFFQKDILRRAAGTSLAILLGNLYLGLVEYEAGFELVRLLLLFILAGRVVTNLRERVVKTIKSWLPYSLIVLGFGFWRIFLFQGDRKATDVDVQFEQVKLYPLQTLYRWAVQVIQDLYDVMVSAWAIPLSQLKDDIQRWGGVLAILIVALILFIFTRLREERMEEPPPFQFTREALLLGLLGAIGGLIPIAMVNREVWYPSFSRYALASSVGVSIFLAGLLVKLNGRILRSAVIGVLLLASVLTHHANSVKYAKETAAMRTFWWQVSWRAPQFEKGTTLIANYPVGAAEEDYFVWGPASLIYYPEKQNPESIQPGLYAVVLNRETITKVLTRQGQKFDNRKNIFTYKNYRNILILTQPSVDSCVHVIDGRQPEYSSSEWDSIRVAGQYSEIERVLVDETPHAPPTVVFGAEPPRGWCYYYEKADLARQKGDWLEVLRLGEEAFDQGLSPKDAIEWMPFLQAYAAASDIKRLSEIAPKVVADTYIAQQACLIVGGMPGLTDSAIETVDSLYCPE